VPATSDGVVKLINAGAKVESVDANGRTSAGLIKIGQAIAQRGGKPRFVNCQSTSADGLISVHQALGGNVVFEGV
jgi:hypothetical protein